MMKCTAVFLLALAATTAAHAQLLLPQGTRGQLRVEYEYSNTGAYAAPSKDQKRDWKMLRRVTITAQYAAQAPQPFGPLHQGDAKQQAQLDDIKTRGDSVYQKMSPMAGDMLAITQKCEGEAIDRKSGERSESKFEACVGRAVSSYGDKMTITSDMKSAGATGASIGKDLGGKRFQQWKLTSLAGSYRIDEIYNKQVYEMTCTEAKTCRRTDTRQGGGELPAPAGGKSEAGAYWIEVDAEKKDMILTLPMPLSALEYTQTVVTSIPGDRNVSQKSASGPWMAQIAKEPVTVTIPADLREVKGNKEIKLAGKDEEGGLLRVSWIFTRQ